MRKQARGGRGRSSLEQGFALLWGRLHPEEPLVEEYTFSPPRRWRFDFAFPDSKVAVEMEGGAWSGGRHVVGKGFQKDCEKYNQATLLGWKVLRYTIKDMQERPLQVIEEVYGLAVKK